MRYQIKGRHIDIGEALDAHVRAALSAMIEKYAQRPTDAQVTFSRDGARFVCEAVVHLSTGLSVKAKAQAHEIYAGFDACRDKMEKQLRRYKRRLRDHHRMRSTPVAQSDATSYVIAAEEAADAPEPESLQPMIVAETETKVPALSVGEAVMQLELSSAPLLVFRNEGHSGVNVVYRRDDGNIGWIDPRHTA